MTQTSFSRPSAAATAAARNLLDSSRRGVATNRGALADKATFKATALPSLLAVNGKTQYRPFYDVNGVPAYLEAYIPTHPNAAQRSGWVAVHRVVAENNLGRYLRKGERVQFRDGNGFNVSSQNVFVKGA
jgi:hypothetical protein